MSAALQAHLNALSAHILAQGQACVLGSDTFYGSLSRLNLKDPRLLGAPRGLYKLVTITAELPATPPTKGDLLTVGDAQFRVANTEPTLLPGSSEFILAPA